MRKLKLLRQIKPEPLLPPTHNSIPLFSLLASSPFSFIGSLRGRGGIFLEEKEKEEEREIEARWIQFIMSICLCVGRAAGVWAIFSPEPCCLAYPLASDAADAAAR